MEFEWWMAVVGVALAFDFVNGFHDSANAIATVVATRVLSPAKAVLMAGFFNFVGPFVFSLAVASTVGKGIIDSSIVTTNVVFAALVGATVWDLITWRWGLPTSSSHALVGGLVGAGFAAAGLSSVSMPTGAEFGRVGLLLFQGAAGGLVVGVVLIPWSRLRLPRGLMPVFALAGMAALGWFTYQHHDPGRELIKTVMIDGVFLLLGLVLGIAAWAASRQPMSWRVAPIVAVPGALGMVAVAALLGELALGGLTKVLVFMIVSPILGFCMGFLFSAVIQWVVKERNPHTVSVVSGRMQLVSSGFYALTHGTNDAQKTMGVIAVLLLSASLADWEAGGMVGSPPEFHVPTWVIIASAGAMGFGTAFGGWRIVKTMASRITHLKPHQGFAAETAGGVVLVAMAESGIPVSTTHAISSSIMGVGATRRASAVRWSVGRRMILAWIWTIPASAAMSYATLWLLERVT